MAETITDVRPFTRVKDVDVEMTVVKPPAIIGLGNLLILHEVDAGSSSTAPKPATQARLLAQLMARLLMMATRPSMYQRSHQLRQ